jgi:hypothetical protein
VLVRLERDVAHLAGRSNEKRVEGARGCEGREANEEGRGARSRVGHFLKKKIGTSQVKDPATGGRYDEEWAPRGWNGIIKRV